MPEEHRIIIQPEAQSNIESAYRWINADSPNRALKWLEGVMKAIHSLRMFPTRCPLVPENEFFAEEIRQLFYGKRHGTYRILFTIRATVVHILYIRHGAQDWVRPEMASDEEE